ncbi:MAG: ATP synthase F1 subunit epsilon [Prevotellaceae bacterium]|jgi:F-type H+-transporting ATPase subunit epsilon|nr:ATP synthase F1 subunit epsilon [Prevotellaceae bacterium]
MKLSIITPLKTIFSGEVSAVTLPGEAGLFTVLENHAPIISTLVKGKIMYRTAEKENFLEIAGGFVEVNKNNINLCVELPVNK